MTTYVTADEARPVFTSRPEPMARLPLHAELYLVAHHDDTGELLINKESLAIGLAGAILLDLWLADRVVVGWAYDHRSQQWRPEPGRLTRVHTEPVGDPLTDTALAAVEYAARTEHRGNQTRAWLRGFAANDLYERVRADMAAARLLHHARRRRFAGLVKTDTYLPAHSAFPVRVRARMWDAVTFHQQRPGPDRYKPDVQCVAVCGLVAVLGLAEYFYLGDMSASDTAKWFRYVVEERNNPTVNAVIAAVDAGRGDLAVAAMR